MVRYIIDNLTTIILFSSLVVHKIALLMVPNTSFYKFCDVLTKAGVSAEKVLTIFKTGHFEFLAT